MLSYGASFHVQKRFWTNILERCLQFHEKRRERPRSLSAGRVQNKWHKRAELPTRFEIQELDEDQLIVTTTDIWFAWPPAIANDPQALDTVSTNAGFNALFIEYAEIVEATFTMEFDRD